MKLNKKSKENKFKSKTLMLRIESKQFNRERMNKKHLIKKKKKKKKHVKI